MTRNSSLPSRRNRVDRSVIVERRSGRGDPRALLARLRAGPVEPEPEVSIRPISSKRFTREKASEGSGMTPIYTPKTGCGLARPIASLGPTACDALRLVNHVRGTFGADLIGGVL